MIFGKWSEMLICTWLGLDVMVDPFSLAVTGEIRVQVSLLADIQFRYPLAFCASADSGRSRTRIAPPQITGRLQPDQKPLGPEL